MRVTWRTLLCVLLAAAAGHAENIPTTDAQQRWWAHMTFLASDALEGRETGSDGYRKAAGYVADQFAKAGLTPGAGQGFLQPIRFRSRRIVEEQSSLALVRNGKAEPLALGPDATFNMRVDHAPAVEAPLVFVGYGLVVPEAKHDDLNGLDVKGKVVVFIAGGPSSVPGAVRAHYQSASVRWAALQAAGAVGTISIPNPRSMDVPWERSSANRLQPSLAIDEPGFDATPGQRLALTFNPARAERLFDGSGHTFAELLKMADAGQALPRFPLPASVRATVRVEASALDSHNVVGILRGSDATLQNEFVVLSAHLDHEGIGAPIAGDGIYNGAMDNASGIATLIETARAMAAATPRPRRSLVFLAVTAEENGLLGSQYYAAKPTVAGAAIVANINMDMFLPLFPMRSVMILGLDESDLGTIAREVAGRLGVAVQADPEPQRNRFIRSDQYSFIRRGVPALAMKVGYEPGSPEAALAAAWTRDRYHAPSDDLQQPIDLQAAADFTRWTQMLCAAIADRAERPRWHEASFFRRFDPGASPTPQGR